MAAAAILDFWNFKFLTLGTVKNVELHQHAKRRKEENLKEKNLLFYILILGSVVFSDYVVFYGDLLIWSTACPLNKAYLALDFVIKIFKTSNLDTGTYQKICPLQTSGFSYQRLYRLGHRPC